MCKKEFKCLVLSIVNIGHFQTIDIKLVQQLSGWGIMFVSIHCMGKWYTSCEKKRTLVFSKW